MGWGLACSTSCSFSKLWRWFTWARGSECCFSSPWCFTSAKSVSHVSEKSLVHRAHMICSCVAIAILDLPWISLVHFILFVSFCLVQFFPMLGVEHMALLMITKLFISFLKDSVIFIFLCFWWSANEPQNVATFTLGTLLPVIILFWGCQ
jgi:hypothetical protein